MLETKGEDGRGIDGSVSQVYETYVQRDWHHMKYTQRAGVMPSRSRVLALLSTKLGIPIRQRGDDVKAWTTGELSDIFGLDY